MFVACKFVDRAEMLNCTSSNGTWYNHTCVTVQLYGQEFFNEAQHLTANMTLKDHYKDAAFPSDEYFQ